MHPSMLVVSSPKGKRNVTLAKKEKMEQVYNFSMKQVSQMWEFYDDVKYQETFINKFVLIGRIKEVTKSVSPRNIPILKIKLDDGTTNWRENKSFILYDIKKEAKLVYAMKHNLYIKLGCTAKVAGLVYKTEVQVSVSGVQLVRNFNEITSHWLRCIKASLVTL